MTREQLKDRRRRMAEEAAKGLPTHSIAAAYDVTIYTVLNACREHGVKPSGRHHFPRWVRGRWSQVDWALSNAEIARQMGVSMQWVWTARRRAAACPQGVSETH
jgi:transposase